VLLDQRSGEGHGRAVKPSLGGAALPGPRVGALAAFARPFPRRLKPARGRLRPRGAAPPKTTPSRDPRKIDRPEVAPSLRCYLRWLESFCVNSACSAERRPWLSTSRTRGSSSLSKAAGSSQSPGKTPERRMPSSPGSTIEYVPETSRRHVS